jgi:hypothetical protein
MVFVELKKGSTGEAVTVFQCIMNMLQYVGADGKPLTIDGEYGENCEYACNTFQTVQRAYGYECGTDGKNDSIFGIKCWERFGLID